MRRAALALAVLALAGCGGKGGRALVDTTAAKLGRIHSGTIGLALLVTPKGSGGQQVGFKVDGPVALNAQGDLPTAQLRYTQVVGDRRSAVTLISKGELGYVDVAGRAYEMKADQVEQLRSVAGSLQAAGGLSRLDLRGWISNPSTTDCGELAPGQDVDCVRGQLDIGKAVGDLVGLGRAVGHDVPELEGAGAGELRRSVKSADVRLATGHEDRLLRALVVDVRFRDQVTGPLRGLLGGLAGSTLHFSFQVADPNQPVQVTTPAHALPYERLSGGG